MSQSSGGTQIMRGNNTDGTSSYDGYSDTSFARVDGARSEYSH